MTRAEWAERLILRDGPMEEWDGDFRSQSRVVFWVFARDEGLGFPEYYLILKRVSREFEVLIKLEHTPIGVCWPRLTRAAAVLSARLSTADRSAATRFLITGKLEVGNG